MASFDFVLLRDCYWWFATGPGTQGYRGVGRGRLRPETKSVMTYRGATDFFLSCGVVRRFQAFLSPGLIYIKTQQWPGDYGNEQYHLGRGGSLRKTVAFHRSRKRRACNFGLCREKAECKTGLLELLDHGPAISKLLEGT